MEAEPRHKVDKRLMMVDTEAQDLASGAGIFVAATLGVEGAFVLPGVVLTDDAGPAALDSL